MRIAVLSLFPEMFQGFLSSSIIGRAIQEELLHIEVTDIRPFSDKKHKNTDDYPFGGGAGMVMLAQPIVDAVRAMRAKGFSGPCIYLSPHGRPLTQQKVISLAQNDDIVLLCGHYEGVDQRAIEAVVDEEISVGDFILTGGELPAMCLIDAVARYVPGVLGSDESTDEESFTDGLLEYPQYTRPRVFEGKEVPEILMNGNHALIKAWRRKESLHVTLERRPDLFASAPMTEKERREALAWLETRNGMGDR